MFVPGSILGTIAIAIVVQIALFVVAKVIEAKNKSGGWREFFRPFFAALGIMDVNARANKHWKVPSDLNIPKDLLCPISCAMLVCPVVTPWGQVYDRAPIEDQVVRKNTCPDHRPLTIGQLRACPEMLRLVDEYATHHGLRLVNN